MKRIDALTSTRGIAALMVVIFHYGSSVFPFYLAPQLFLSGYLAVSYFFVLSGFVMVWTYSNKSLTWRDFWIRRCQRIIPVYWLALFATAIPNLYSAFKDGRLESGFIKQLTLSATFLQAFIPGYSMTLNRPGWSISVEMVFYLTFPALFALSKRYPDRFLVYALTIFCASQVAHMTLISYLHPTFPSRAHELIYYNPLFHINEFIVGMLGARLYQWYSRQKWTIPPLLPLLLLIISLCYIPRDRFSPHNGLLAPIYLLLIICLTRSESKLLCWRPLVYLGEISYSIYIFQYPLHVYLNLINANWLGLDIGPAFGLYLAALLTWSSLAYHWIEKPLAQGNWLRKITASPLRPGLATEHTGNLPPSCNHNGTIAVEVNA